jgi:hypothetical protein
MKWYIWNCYTLVTCLLLDSYVDVIIVEMERYIWTCYILVTYCYMHDSYVALIIAKRNTECAALFILKKKKEREKRVNVCVYAVYRTTCCLLLCHTHHDDVTRSQPICACL